MRMRSWAATAAIGIAAIGVAVAQQPKAAVIKSVAATITPERAKPTDLLSAMLTDARAAYTRLRDYSGTYTRQERIDGTLGAEQVGEMKMRVSPAGVHVRFARPNSVSGMEIAYSAARKDAKVHYRLAGQCRAEGIPETGCQ